ncbi:MAG: mechanosensitive ion channel [Anaerolineae bacterium]|nr:mechanosensitive ion channel [Anaerolineae bacterium]
MIDSFNNLLVQLGLRILPALLILLLTWLVGRLDTHILRLLLRLIDRGVDFVRKTDVDLDRQLETAFARPLQLLIVTMGAWLALLALDLPEIFRKIINPAGSSFVLASVFWAIYRLVGVVIYYINKQKDNYAVLDDVTLHFGRQLVRAGVLILAFFSIAREWGYDLGAMLAGLGLGGLAVALAAQDAIANLIGYFAIMIDLPFAVGEFIDTGAVKGTVEKIGFRSTKIRQLDQSLAIVPNKEITATTITNWSRLKKRRLNLTLSLSRAASPAQILAVVEDVRSLAVNHDLIIEDSVTVKFSGFGESSLDILVIAMLDTPDWGEFMAAQEEIQLRIIDILAAHGVSLAVGQAILVSQQDHFVR